MLELILEVAIVVVTLLLFGIIYYFAVRKKMVDNALTAINLAEDLEAIGSEKMSFAIDNVYATIPAVLKPFITRSLVERVIQEAFNKVKEFAEKQAQKNIEQS